MASGDTIGSKETSDSLLSSVIGGSEETFTYECDACKLDGHTKEGKFYCCSCEDYLCSECESFHKKVKVTRSHEIVAADKIPHKSYSQKQVMGYSGKPKQDELCACNQHRDVEYYCEEHVEVFCSLCKNVHHNRCSIATIDEMCSDRAFPDNFTSTLKKVDLFIQKAQELENKNNEASNKLETMELSCRGAVKEVRMQMNLLLDKLEEKALNELKIKEKEQSDLLKEGETTLNSTLHLLISDKQRGDQVIQNEDKRQMFITCTKINKTLPSYEATINLCQDKLIGPSLIFEKNRYITDLLEKLDSLGIINSNLSFTEVMNLNFMDAEVKAHRIVDMKDVSDNLKPWIRGTVFLKNMELLIADYHNKRLTLFDPSVCSKLATIRCDASPWDIALVDNKYVLVSFPDVKELRYLHVNNIKFGQIIKLKESIKGVTVMHDSIVVACKSREYAVLILDRSGTILHTVTTRQLEGLYSGPNRYYVAVSYKEDQVYIQADTNIICLTLTGEIICTYTDSALTGARGFALDCQDNLLVCCISSHNLHVFEHGGSKHKTLLSENDQIPKPYAVAFRAKDGTLAVSDWDKGQLHILTLVGK